MRAASEGSPKTRACSSVAFVGERVRVSSPRVRVRVSFLFFSSNEKTSLRRENEPEPARSSSRRFETKSSVDKSSVEAPAVFLSSTAAVSASPPPCSPKASASRKVSSSIPASDEKSSPRMKRHASERFSRGSNAAGRREGGPRSVARSFSAGDTRVPDVFLTTTGAPSGSASEDVRRGEGEVFSSGHRTCDSAARLSSPSSSSRFGPPSRPTVRASPPRAGGLMPPSGHHAGGEGGRFMPPAGHHAGVAGASPSPPMVSGAPREPRDARQRHPRCSDAPTGSPRRAQLGPALPPRALLRRRGRSGRARPRLEVWRETAPPPRTHEPEDARHSVCVPRRS